MQAQILFDLRSGNTRCAIQKYQLTVVLQIIELVAAFPVAAHDHRINMVFLHIVDLLLPTVLRDHQIHIANGLQHLLAGLIGVVSLFALFGVKLIGRQRHNQVIAHSLCPLQQPNMTVMEQIKGAVC